VWDYGGAQLGAERRHWQRLPLAIPLFLRGTDKEGKEFIDFTLALNVSAGGALVATRRPLSASTKLSLEIPSAPLPRVITALKPIRSLKARIVRSTQKDSYSLCALRFSHPLT